MLKVAPVSSVKIPAGRRASCASESGLRLRIASLVSIPPINQSAGVRVLTGLKKSGRSSATIELCGELAGEFFSASRTGRA